MDRRDFFKTVAITGAAMTIQRSEAMEILTQTINKANGDKPDLVAVMGGEPEVMFRRAISELGGMKQFIKPGQKVVVKPNIGWDKVPELAGNTNPKLITEIIKQCFAAGAKEVTVFDHTCDDWQKCYKNSGIEAAAKEAGADKIYKVGGAQAIAALAYGTESISKVDKIVGPGNIYVALAT